MKDKRNPEKKYWIKKPEIEIPAQLIIDCSIKQIRKFRGENGN